MKKNSFITFISSVVPGCGQMYQGYMRRGFSLAFYFWGIVFISAVFDFGVFSIFLPVIWAFAFFDSFNIRSLTPSQRENFSDTFIPTSLNFSMLSSLFKKARFATGAGWGLIVFGAFSLASSMRFVLYKLFEIIGLPPHYIDILFNLFPKLLIGAGIILLGVYMLRKVNSAKNNDNDIPQFKGGEKNE